MATVEADRDWFESQGIPVGSTARWAEGNACYSEGWALGKLKYFTGDQIQAAYLAGNLLPGDILLTDGVPAEIPFVAGILSLLPSTPSSHVAILAQTFCVPFAHLALVEDATRAQQLVGRTVLLSVRDDAGVGEVTLKLPQARTIKALACFELPLFLLQGYQPSLGGFDVSHQGLQLDSHIRLGLGELGNALGYGPFFAL